MRPESRACLDAISALSVGGVAPSYKELRSYLGLSSISRVHAMVEGLVRDGYVAREPRRPRSLVVLTGNDAYTPAVLSKLPTDELKTILATVSGVLGRRLGVPETDQALRRIGDRLSGRPRVET